MNQGFGKDFYRKGNSVKRFGRYTEPPDSQIFKLLSSSPSQKSALIMFDQPKPASYQSLGRMYCTYFCGLCCNWKVGLWEGVAEKPLCTVFFVLFSLSLSLSVCCVLVHLFLHIPGEHLGYEAMKAKPSPTLPQPLSNPPLQHLSNPFPTPTLTNFKTPF